MNDIFDYDVCDRQGERVGTVENIWMDADDDIEFIGIKTGWLGIGRNHLIPAEGITIDNQAQVIRLPYDEELIKSSPPFEISDELVDIDESAARAHFGVTDWKSDREEAIDYTNASESESRRPASLRAEDFGDELELEEEYQRSQLRK
jgi:hypothetical protein